MYYEEFMYEIKRYGVKFVFIIGWISNNIYFLRNIFV